MTARVVEIVTTAHWEGDPRLNRHVRYLSDAGHSVTLTSFKRAGRLSAMWRGHAAIMRSRAQIVIIPDPEMFLTGSLAARFKGKLPVIDIHEDYGRAAMAREWVPSWGRWLVRVLAGAAVSLGRLAAWRVLVAAPELSREGDFTALNLPDPQSLPISVYHGSRRLVYVGDVTRARGALAMIEVLAELDETFDLLLIGNVNTEVADSIVAKAEALGIADRVEMTGRLGHDEAWNKATGALAGLNLLEAAPAYRLAVATKLWEYMAVGLPPIVSSLPGQARLISRIDPALVVDTPADAAAMAQAIASDPDRRAAIATKGRQLLERAWDENRPDLTVQRAVEP